jgi:hypothetical protein
LCARSYDSWIYNYLCNRCLSPINLGVQILLMRRCTLQYYVIKVVSHLQQVCPTTDIKLGICIGLDVLESILVCVHHRLVPFLCTLQGVLVSSSVLMYF